MSDKFGWNKNDLKKIEEYDFKKDFNDFIKRASEKLCLDGDIIAYSVVVAEIFGRIRENDRDILIEAAREEFKVNRQYYEQDVQNN